MKKAFVYSLKVWLTSALIFPIIVVLVRLSENSAFASFNYKVFFPSCLYISLLALIGSLVPWLVALLFMKRIIKRTHSPFATKLTISSIVIILFGGILLIGASGPPSSHHTEGMLFFEGFVIATALCAWFYKLEASNTDVSKLPDTSSDI
jgi:hypothetical protein